MTLITRQELSRILGVSTRTIVSLEKQGKIPRIELNAKTLRYSLPDVLRTLGIESTPEPQASK